jgi:hypothetical protein
LRIGTLFRPNSEGLKLHTILLYLLFSEETDAAPRAGARFFLFAELSATLKVCKTLKFIKTDHNSL